MIFEDAVPNVAAADHIDLLRRMWRIRLAGRSTGFAGGTLVEIVAGPGAEVSVGDPIAWLDDDT